MVALRITTTANIIVGMPWNAKPTLLKEIRPNDYYVFVDESGSITDHAAFLKKASKNLQSLQLRDSTFATNIVFMTGRASIRAKKQFDELKTKHFGRNDFLLHNREINGHSGAFASLGKDDEWTFEQELDDLICAQPFKRIGLGVNKKLFFAEMAKEGRVDSDAIVKLFFLVLFTRIERCLKEIDIARATIVFEESAPEIDMMIVKAARKLLRAKKAKRIKGGVYFVKKSMPYYPGGSEIADLGSAAVYKYFQNVEFLSLLPKTIGASKSKTFLRSYEMVHYPKKKPTEQ